MIIVAAYDMCRECCDGLICPDQAIPVKNRQTFLEFCQVLSEQMLEYNPRDGKYPGDERFRAVTQQNKKRRADLISTTGFAADGLSVAHLKIALF